MGRDKLDEITFTVPSGAGYVLGDFLRKFALRGVPTWQIAGYKVDSTTSNFGFSNGALPSYLKLFEGHLVLEKEYRGSGPLVKKFTWDGQVYRNGDMYIAGLNHAFGESLTVVLNCTNNVMSEKQNYEVCRKAVGGDAQGYFAVPSRHVAARSFKFDVTPIDDRKENLTIAADYNVLISAYEMAVESLTGLNI